MKLLVVFILVGNPAIGMAGAPIGALVCYFCIGALNIFSIRRVVKDKPALVTNLLRPLIPALLMGGAVFGTYQGLLWLLGEGTSNIILCGGPIAVGVAVYAVSIVVFKTITREDCLLLPKGEKIAKLMGL